MIKKQLNTNKKILFLNGKLFPLNQGDAIYSLSVLQRLVKCSEIFLLTFDDQAASDNHSLLPEEITRFNVNNKHSFFDKVRRVLIHGASFVKYNKAAKLKIKEISKQTNFDIIYCDHLRCYPLAKYALKRNPSAKLVYIAHNFEYLNYKERKRLAVGLLDRIKVGLEFFNIQNLERKALVRADKVYCISKNDFVLINSHYKIKILPIFLPVLPIYPIRKNERTKYSHCLAIVGSMNWYPNVEGVLNFYHKVFKALLVQIPNIKLFIVGKDPDIRLLDLKSEHVIVTGIVDDVSEYLDMVDFLIVPNEFGTGVKVKIVDGITNSTPVITMRKNIEGYPSEIFEKEAIVDSIEDFYNSIMHFYSDFNNFEQYRARLGKTMTDLLNLNADKHSF